MYVSAAFSAHFCFGPLWTSVAMSSQWDVHKQQGGWSQRDWSQSGWSDASRWGSGDQIPSGSKERSMKLQAMADEHAPHLGVLIWQPSLRVKYVPYVPVAVTPSKRFVRSVTPRGEKQPVWLTDKQWKDRVEELLRPLGTSHLGTTKINNLVNHHLIIVNSKLNMSMASRRAARVHRLITELAKAHALTRRWMLVFTKTMKWHHGNQFLFSTRKSTRCLVTTWS